VNPPNPLSGELDGFPENLRAAAFMEAWAEWTQHRRGKKEASDTDEREKGIEAPERPGR